MNANHHFPTFIKWIQQIPRLREGWNRFYRRYKWAIRATLLAGFPPIAYVLICASIGIRPANFGPADGLTTLPASLLFERALRFSVTWYVMPSLARTSLFLVDNLLLWFGVFALGSALANAKRWRLFLSYAGIVLVFGTADLYRTVHYTHPSLGEMYVQYRLGKARYLKEDTNWDGNIDVIARFDPPREVENAPPDEMWDDRNFDGRFDVHLVAPPGQLQRLEIDTDFDGVFDTQLAGEAVSDWYREHSRKIYKRPEGH